MSPIVDINNDGVDELLWGERCIELDKGTLKASVQTWDFIPRDKGEAIHGEALYEYEKYPEDKTEKDLERHVASAVRGHYKNFLSCIDKRTQPVSNINEGYISATSCILANVAMELGRTLKWDPKKGRIIGDEEANAMLERSYRSPWIHPTPENI